MPLKHISVSQYKTYTDCKKKWYIEKVVGIRTPGTPATEFGSKFHEFMEKWVETKGNIPIPDFMASFYAASPDFFKQLTKYTSPKIEEELNYILPVSQIAFVGYVDLQSSKGKVQDYKTVGSWKWALREDTLRDDIQMNMYGHLITDAALLVHFQFNKQTHMMKTVAVPFDPRKGKKVHDLIDEAAGFMQADSKKPIEDIEKNTKSCKKYGGCPFRDYCTNQVSLKELRVKIENPHVKKRGKEELNNMGQEDRLLELMDEKSHSKKVNNKIGSLKMGLSRVQQMKDRQKAKREALAKEKEELDNQENFMEKTPHEDDTATSRETVVMDNKQPVETPVLDEVAPDISPKPASKPENVEPKPEEVKTRKKVAKVAQVPTILLNCDVTFKLGLRTKPTIPAVLLNEKFLAPILEARNADVFSSIPYNAGIQDLAKYAQTIIDILLEEAYIVLDTRLPVDMAIWSWILETRRLGEFNVFGGSHK